MFLSKNVYRLKRTIGDLENCILTVAFRGLNLTKVALIGAELEENLGLRYMASSLESKGHRAEIIPFNSSQDTSPLEPRSEPYLDQAHSRTTGYSD